MTLDLTAWREDVQDALEAAYPTAEVLSGERDTPVSRDRDRACVFTSPVKPDPSNVNNSNSTLTVRFWKAYPKISALAAEVPRDPSPIEALELGLAALFKANLTGFAGIDYTHVQSITADVNDEYGVEVVATGWSRNPAESGG